jgi:hypothetical protein
VGLESEGVMREHLITRGKTNEDWTRENVAYEINRLLKITRDRNCPTEQREIAEMQLRDYYEMLESVELERRA